MWKLVKLAAGVARAVRQTMSTSEFAELVAIAGREVQARDHQMIGSNDPLSKRLHAATAVQTAAANRGIETSAWLINLAIEVAGVLIRAGLGKLLGTPAPVPTPPPR